MTEGVFYTGGALDRAGVRRRDEAWVAERLGRRDTLVVPVWRNRSLIAGEAAPEAALVTGSDARKLIGLAGHVALLGLDGGTAVAAIDLSDHEQGPVRTLVAPARFVDLRRTAALMERSQASLLAHARGMMHWHRNHLFCGTCGSATHSRQGGHLRVCGSCGREHFPRTDPAVIMLVVRDGACLLARKSEWTDGMYSTLAGFVEPGESLEEAVAREVFEETAVTVADVRYRASQPWPFPASLMLGFRARATTTRIQIDDHELAEARWFRPADLAHGRHLPRADSIARWLIDEWLAEGCDSRK